MKSILLNIFLLLPLAPDDYADLCVEAAIEGVQVEDYIGEYIRKVLNARETSVFVEEEDESAKMLYTAQ